MATKKRTGDWKLKKSVHDYNECEGQTSSGQCNKYCEPAYNPGQIARAVLPDVCDDPNVTGKTIAKLFRAKGIYSIQPSMINYRSVRREILHDMTAMMMVDMVSMRL